MKITMRPAQPARVIKRLGLGPGGRAQLFWTGNVQRRIKKYLPLRDKGAVAKAVDAGADKDGKRIVIRGPQMRYLYQGKVMVGRAPKQATGMDLVYTKDHNAKAGPFWDKRLKQAELPQMKTEFRDYLRRGK